MTLIAIVLAGGRSSRFGEDKLAAALGDTSVLAATIKAVAPLADRVIVAGPSLPRALEGDVPIVLLPDARPFEGPLAALAAILASLPGLPTPGPDAAAIVVGGDMPALVPAVLVRMLDVLDVEKSADAVILGRPEAATGAAPGAPARRQVLPLAIRVQPGSCAAREAVEAGQRSLQALLDRIAAIELPAAHWLALDPDGRTLTDVDTRADLDRIKRA
ncbi:MAG TPA: NTP transferase domain-containing protein [Candidatus Limnocylindrales bacterium]|nr:NTP transferase domain-containing protein [Candidatus Limnocylindrales bacterium]